MPTHWSGYELFTWTDGHGAQPARIANRYLSGAAVEQLLADEQYAIGSGPAVTATTASAVQGNTLWALTDHLGGVRDLVDNNGVIRCARSGTQLGRHGRTALSSIDASRERIR